jgi:hypothetical protein
MSIFIPSSAIEKTRALAQSALPDAPVVPDEPRVRRRLQVRARAGAVLRASARRELKLADRIDPVCVQPG